MVKDKQTIIADIKDYMAKGKGQYSDWYVGIASVPRDRLFNDHSVKEKGDYWILREAESESAARDIEKYFTDVLKTDGGTGGGVNPQSVYAYKKRSNTNP